MYFLLLFLFLAVIFIVSLLYEPVSVSFLLDTVKMDMHAAARWTQNLRIEARTVNYSLLIRVYLYGLKVYSGSLKKRVKSGRKILSSLKLTDTAVKINCGFREPLLLGFFCAGAGIIASLLKPKYMVLEPEFTTGDEYLVIKAKTKLQTLETLKNMLRMKSQSTTRRKSYD
jgi:hypothetical protein